MNFIKNVFVYAKLVKIEHTLFALPYALSALVLAHICGYRFGILKLALCLLAFTAARAAAMSFNRLVDIKFDAKNPRTKMRPSVNGEISPQAVGFFTGISAFAFVVCAYFINTLCFWLSFPALAVLFGYSCAKRFTSAAHYALGLALALAPAGAWIAAANSLDCRILALSGALFFNIAAFDIIYALQDLDFDVREKLHSVPAKFGRRGALAIAGISFCAAAFLFFLTGELFALQTVYFICVATIAAMYVFGLFSVAFGGAAFVNATFFYINVAVSWLSFFGIAYALI